MEEPQRQKLEFLGDEEVEVAFESDLPRTSFFSIEYPALLRLHTRKDEGNRKEEHPALSNALRSLSPLPSPYSTPLSALRHIGQLAERTGRVGLECRLGQACIDASTSSTSNASVFEESTPVSTNDVYRHTIQGELVDVHNVVLKITKRVWRKKRSKVEGSQMERKEYTAVPLGITRRVARFRQLADFLYDPGYVESLEATGGKEEATKKALFLYDSMRQMDIDALKNFRLDEEREDYEIDDLGKDKGKISNIRFPPPPVFDKTEVPFVYGFRQNPTSELETYGEARLDGSLPKRYMNKLKFANIAPIQFSMASKRGRDKDVPSRAHNEVLASRRLDDNLFARIVELFEKQPIWTRVSLYNQFDPEQRRNLINQKQYIAAACYAITDGCWRDTLVRFSYDPRKDKGSRFYQKMSFQMRTRSKRSGVQSKQSSLGPDTDRSGSLTRQDGDPTEDELEDGESHIFDGVTTSRVRGNYLLIDVHDEMVKPLIYQEGRNVLRDEPDRDTGWFTPKHYEKIKLVMQARYHQLLEDGVPASKDECDAIVTQVENNFSSKGLKR